MNCKGIKILLALIGFSCISIVLNAQSMNKEYVSILEKKEWASLEKNQNIFLMTYLLDKEVPCEEKYKPSFIMANIFTLFNQSNSFKEKVIKSDKKGLSIDRAYLLISEYLNNRYLANFQVNALTKEQKNMLLSFATIKQWSDIGGKSLFQNNVVNSKKMDLNELINTLKVKVISSELEKDKVETQKLLDILLNQYVGELSPELCIEVDFILKTIFTYYLNKSNAVQIEWIEDSLFVTSYKLFNALSERIPFSRFSSRDVIMAISLNILEKTNTPQFDPLDKKMVKEEQNKNSQMIFCVEFMTDVMRLLPAKPNIKIESKVLNRYKDFNICYGLYLATLSAMQNDANARTWVNENLKSELASREDEATKLKVVFKDGTKEEYRTLEEKLGFGINRLVKKLQFTHFSVFPKESIQKSLETLKGSGFSYGHTQLLKLLETYENQTKGGELKQSVNKRILEIKALYSKKEIDLDEYIAEMKNENALTDFDLMIAFRNDNEGRNKMRSYNSICEMLALHAMPDDGALIIKIWYKSQGRDSFLDGFVNVVEKRHLRNVLDDFLLRFENMKNAEHSRRIAHILMVLVQDSDIQNIHKFIEKFSDDVVLEFLGLAINQLVAKEKCEPSLKFLCDQLLDANLSDKHFFYYDLILRAKLNQPFVTLEKDLVKRKEQIINFLTHANIIIDGYNQKK